MMVMIVINMMIMICAAFVFAKTNVSERLREAASGVIIIPYN